MKRKEEMYCIVCKKKTEHTPYSEERDYIYRDVLVTYNEEGWICNHCGEEQQTVAQFDASMAEIRESYFILKK